MTTSYRPCGHIFVVVAVVIGITEATQPRFTVVQNGDEDPEVETEYGRVRGVRELDAKSGRHVTAFYGIPFATPPVEEFRFRPPYPAKPWTDTYDCTKKKLFQVCPQFPTADQRLDYGSEDCLYLNIYVPSENPILNQSSFVVYFWIYGGGFIFGDKNEAGWYDGKNLATSRNVVVVEPNYRLGALGFFSHTALAQETGGTTGNYGVQDQQLALKFAYNNIKNFGGDPSHIVIAGSCSTSIFFVGKKRAEIFSREVAAKAGCDPNAAYPTFLKCLREVNFKNFFMNGRQWPLPIPGTNHSIVPPLFGVMPFGITVDEDPRGLRALPLDVLRTAPWHTKPLLIGSNKDEGTIFLQALPTTIPGVSLPLSDDGAKTALLHFFNESATEDILFEYQAIANNDQKIIAILRDFMFLCPSLFAADALATLGTPVFLYQFVMDLPNWIDWKMWGDYHTVELSFVFDNEWPPVIHNFDSKEKEMADGLGTFWTNLARFGDPSGGGSPLAWPRYTTADKKYLELDIPFRVSAGLKEQTCKFWSTHDSKFGDPSL